MNHIDSATNVHDIAALDSLRQQALSGDNDEKALKTAAQHFESIFMNMLLSSMRKASDVLASDSPFNSQTTRFYRDMHDQQLSMHLSQTGSLGLADIIVKQLGNNKDGNYKDASILRTDGQLPTSKAEKITTTKEDPSFFADPVEFIQSLLPKAEKAAEKIGISPLFMIAQAALETGWGKKIIQKPDGNSSYNLFGIKADGRWDGEKAKVQTLEFKDGVAKQENAFFRAYSSLEEGMSDYVNFLSADTRYDKAIQHKENPEKYFNALQKAGYATDPQYAQKIIGILDSPFFEQFK